MEYGLRYLGDGEVKLQGDTYSDCCFSLGSRMISLFIRKLTSMALSSAETE
jgi:hypothetical protein